MKRIYLALVFCALCITSVSAHAGPHAPGRSIFKKKYKYRINTREGHIGHFYLKRSQVSFNNSEKLRVEHTIHLEEDIVKKLNVKYNDKANIMKYNFNMDDRTYFFTFYLNDGEFHEASNPGSMSIFDKTTKSFTVSNVTLDPMDDSVEEQGHEHDDGDSHGSDS